MIDLIFWSFVVALVPIALSFGTSLLATIAAPFGPPADPIYTLHREGRPIAHLMVHPAQSGDSAMATERGAGRDRAGFVARSPLGPIAGEADYHAAIAILDQLFARDKCQQPAHSPTSAGWRGSPAATSSPPRPGADPNGRPAVCMLDG